VPPVTGTDESALPRHPIGVVADRTGLSQDVLRVWERRYRVVEPGRSATGQRLYSDADIERLRLLSLATQTGRSIGLIAPLPTADLAQMVREDEEARALKGDSARRDEPASDLIAAALERAIALDGSGLEALLRRAILTMGVPAFIDTLAAPLLTRVGDEWHAGRLAPSHEHLATAVVQRVIAATMYAITAPAGAPNLVVATPVGERHEIGAILAAATATAEGWRVTYLGADLSAGDIATAAMSARATAVALSVVYVADRVTVVEEIRGLRALLPLSIPMLIGGAAASSLGAELPRDGIRLMRDLGELRTAIREEMITGR
jgi:MerR family transcriptional regulator, light-induced transcriptional regulator